ncbi:MAG: histidine kinase [Clostridiales bacterium]|nr:histidine kinase [Clostridiales bacterium]
MESFEKKLSGGIRRQLYAVQLLSLLITTLLSLISIGEIRRFSMDKVSMYADVSFNQAVQNVDRQLQSVVSTARAFAYTELAQQLLIGAGGLSDVRGVYNSAMSNVRFIINTNGNIIDAALVDSEGKRYLFGSQLDHVITSYARERTSFLKDRNIKHGLFTDFFSEDVSRPGNYFMYVLPVYSSLQGEKYGKYIGVCLMLCRTDSICEAMDASLLDNSRLTLLNSNEEVLRDAGLVQNETLKSLSQNYYTFSNADWMLRQLVFEDSVGVTEGLYKNTAVLFIMAALLILIAMIALQLQMINRHNSETQRRLLQLELSKNKLRLSVLQSQINPHFLYNTLACIRGMAMENNLPVIAHIASNMAALFRYSIKGGAFVRLNEELGVTRKYIDIMNLRLDNRISIHVDIPEGLTDIWMVKMMLQPLVENAVFHGIERIEGEGRLSVTGSYISEKQYELRIRDTGAGIPPGKLDVLNALLRAPAGQTEELPQSGEAGVGLSNIQQKIKLLLGDAYGLRLESVFGEYTAVIITMPVLLERPSDPA